MAARCRRRWIALCFFSCFPDLSPLFFYRHMCTLVSLFLLPPEVLAPANSDKPSTACSLDPTHCADTRRKACVGCLLRLSSGWIDHLKCQFFPLKLRARFLFTSALETTQSTLQMLIMVANLHSPHSYLIASAKTSEPRRHQPIFSPNILKSLLDRCLYLQLRAATSLILT